MTAAVCAPGPWQPPVHEGPTRVVVVTTMQANVWESACENKGNAAIARDWGIVEDTVKAHLKALYGRCGARNRFHLLLMLSTGELRIRVADTMGVRL